MKTLTFFGILCPPSSESKSWNLAAHGAITAHLSVSSITCLIYLHTKKFKINTCYKEWVIFQQYHDNIINSTALKISLKLAIGLWKL